MRKHEFNDAYRVDGGFFEGQPTVAPNMEKIEHEYPIGIFNKLYTSQRWLQVNVDELKDDQKDWLLNGKLTMCVYPVGCVVVMGFKLDDSPWTVTVLNPRNYLNDNGNLMMYKNTTRYRNDNMQCNYTVTHFVGGEQYYARMRKMKFDNAFYRAFDAAMGKALENRSSPELIQRQTEDCLSWNNKMFLRFKRHNQAEGFEEMSE